MMMNSLNYIQKPLIKAKKLPYKSVQSFLTTLVIWFLGILLIDCFLHFIAINIHSFMNLKINFSLLKIISTENYFLFFIHSSFTAIVTAIYVLVDMLLEKRKIYQVKMIHAYRK